MRKLRFAPSPNGRLHLGHAYSALLNARIAERMGGNFLLRIEDIDHTRCTPALTEHCLTDLAWLGLTWENPVRIQSDHYANYAASLATLKAQGLLYPCFCTRAEVATASTATDPDGAPLYPGTCRHLDDDAVNARLATPHSWRIDMEKSLSATGSKWCYPRFDPTSGSTDEHIAHPARWGDAILARKDIGTSYHIAVVTDDALQGITHIVRGADLEAATDLHVLLQHLLGLPMPHYHHHALLTDEDGDKLAKRKHSTSLADLRAQGATPEQLRAQLGF